MATPPDQLLTEPGDHVTISLSGGGLRATLFALGALLAVVEAGVNARVSSISSVSGGSIANGFISSNGKYDQLTRQECSELVRTAISIASFRGGAVAPRTLAGVVSVAWLSVLIATTLIATGAAIRGQFGTSLFACVGVYLAARTRGLVFERALASAWCRGADGKPTSLSVPSREQDSVEHIFCATDLRTCSPMFLSTRGIYWDRHRRLGSLTTARAVRASASYPLALPPVWIRRQSIERVPAGWSDAEQRWVLLADGGIFNNLGTDWRARLREYAHNDDYQFITPTHASEASLHLVVDAGRPVGTTHAIRHMMPGLAAFSAVERSFAATFQSTLDARRRGFRTDESVEIASATLRPGWGQHPPTALRLPNNVWRAIAWTTRAAPTTLFGLSRGDSTRIVAHGYAVTVIALARAGESGPDEGLVWAEWLKDAVLETMPSGAWAIAPWGYDTWRRDKRKGRG